ncbi:ATP-dependent DNA ligase [Propioniciclava sp. MC1683]|uniref:ATP-dependent DNA ligase n=1 Tax=Propioniciclava sp. MC1683 TaxID=2760309 RepID=UPI0016011641|nr:ATP-dependent DNA ligase [Propioniciclava sp. MC1683]MBB1500331.1 ATP-dependent DNA ligase [Propioniciclava sp. MC1683]
MPLPIALPVEPMLARAVPEVPCPGRPGELSYEPKWDGYRCIVARDGDRVELWSRSRKALTGYFPEVVAACRRHLPEQVVLDAELVVRSGEPGAQRLDWEALSVRIHPSAKRVAALAEQTPAELVCFDLLAIADLDLTPLPQRERRAALVQLLADLPDDAPLHVTRATEDPDEALAWFDAFEGAGLDGVVAKRTDAPYAPGQRTMMKVKHARTAEAVVIGYGWSKGASASANSVGSIHLGLYDDGELIPVGGIGAWSDAVRTQLAAILEPLVLMGAEAERAPRPKDMTRTGVREFVPVRPDLVVEVAFDQLEGKRFRHAAQFVRWRPDREPTSCTLDQVERAPAYDLDGVLRP